MIRVGAVAAESVLARLQRLVDDAQRDKAPLQRIADRISSVFVPAVLIGSVVTFLIWWLVAGNLGEAVLSGLAVLLVACPCAMGLAAPVAMMVGCGRAAAMGIFVRSGDVLERLAKVTGVVFDKTGTLTERHAEVTLVAGATGTSEGEVLSLAASVEAESDHPIAVAILAAAPAGSAATDVRSVPGSGVVGVGRRPQDRSLPVGPARLPASLREAAAERYERGETVVMVERDDQTIGVIALNTPLRTEAKPAVAHLRFDGSPVGRAQRRQRAGRPHRGRRTGHRRGRERPEPGRQGRGPGRHAQRFAAGGDGR